MSAATTTLLGGPGWLLERPELRGRQLPALVVAWSAGEPDRAGEVALFPPGRGPFLLGRGAATADDPAERVVFFRQRPDGLEPRPPLSEAGISRHQLRIRVDGGALAIESIGRCAVLLNGKEAAAGALLVGPGDTLHLKNQLVLLCAERPVELPAVTAAHPFGRPDRHGIVGESPATWELRRALAFAGGVDGHVLVLGESGTGKELAAGAIHGLSRRAGRPMVARSAATFPPGILDAELFGNVKNYPNPGMAERPGLLGEADGSTLFLDEIAEIPWELQAHLLRVLDGGEYHRLGEARPRRASIRFIAATNRSPAELKHDLVARLVLRVSLPSLNERREDVPLLVRHLLQRAARVSPPVGPRFFEGWDGQDGSPRVDPALVDALLRHRFRLHVRELEALLWTAIGASRGDYIAFGDEVAGELGSAVPEHAAAAAALPAGDRPEPSVEEIVACLARHGGNRSRAWRELGLGSRWALLRLLKKHGIDQEQEQ